MSSVVIYPVGVRMLESIVTSECPLTTGALIRKRVELARELRIVEQEIERRYAENPRAPGFYEGQPGSEG